VLFPNEFNDIWKKIVHEMPKSGKIPQDPEDFPDLSDEGFSVAYYYDYEPDECLWSCVPFHQCDLKGI
jgi:hypothetical protein